MLFLKCPMLWSTQKILFTGFLFSLWRTQLLDCSRNLLLCHCNPFVNPVKPRTCKSYPTIRFYFYLPPSKLSSHVLCTFFLERKDELTHWEADIIHTETHFGKNNQWIEGNFGSLPSYVSVCFNAHLSAGGYNWDFLRWSAHPSHLPWW